MAQRFVLFLLLVAGVLPAWGQKPRLELDSLGLPPYPGANSVGNIRLPLAALLKPEPGQTLTGPKLDDLAIQTYRVPLTTSVAGIAAFYLKYASEAGWQLLDDIPDSADSRSLVFHSPAAPGYLTVEIVPGPENTRQIDLTRLLGEVDPRRPGEVLKLTGKRAREQRVEATYTGRFLNLKTNAFERKTVRAVESRAEAGLGVDKAQWVAPMTETYDVTWTVTDATKRMTRADAFAGHGAKIAEASVAAPVSRLTLKGQVRGGQGMMTRVMISGVPAPEEGSAETAREPDEPHIGVLTEWYGLRPPLTAIAEIRPAGVTSRTEPQPASEPVELGPSCNGPLNAVVPWKATTRDTFNFNEDLFGNAVPRASRAVREGEIAVRFEKGSGASNKYTLRRDNTITTTQVQYGYSFNSDWITLPTKKENPVAGEYVVITEGQPIVDKASAGACPPEQNGPAPAG